jgi:hypothetical protein
MPYKLWREWIFVKLSTDVSYEIQKYDRDFRSTFLRIRTPYCVPGCSLMVVAPATIIKWERGLFQNRADQHEDQD